MNHSTSKVIDEDCLAEESASSTVTVLLPTCSVWFNWSLRRLQGTSTGGSLPSGPLKVHVTVPVQTDPGKVNVYSRPTWLTVIGPACKRRTGESTVVVGARIEVGDPLELLGALDVLEAESALATDALEDGGSVGAG
jgi:hypothetical protein